MAPMDSDLRERVADTLAHNDACGAGPVSRSEYLADADVLIALIAPEHDRLAKVVQKAYRALTNMHPIYLNQHANDRRWAQDALEILQATLGSNGPDEGTR